MTQSTPSQQAPGPHGKYLIGSVTDFIRKGTLHFYLGMWRNYGDIARMQMGPMVVHMLAHPEHVHHILVKHRQNYIKDRSHDKLRLSLGEGILTSEGEDWKRQRRLMQPVYTPRYIRRFADIMTDAAISMCQKWEDVYGTAPFAINQEMMQVTMSIISRSMFGFDISETFGDAAQSLHDVFQWSVKLMDSPLSHEDALTDEIRQAFKAIDSFLYEIIAERRQKGLQEDLLSILIQARDEETGAVLNDAELRDEVLITFFAGHETSAQLLTWTWYLLAQHPEVEAKLHAELVSVLGGKRPSMEDVAQLTYTRMVLNEAMRLYSPVGVMARDVVEDDEIDGYHIPARTMVVLFPYGTHRHPDFWQKPTEFYPEHFTPERVKARHRYAYYPFGAGPRICIGNHFSLLESTLILAEVAQRYRLHLEPGQNVEPELVGTVRPKQDIMVTWQQR